MDTILDHVALEVIYLFKACLPDAFEALAWKLLSVQNLRVNANDKHFLIVRAIENADAAALGQRLAAAPQIVVIELLRRGGLERNNLRPLWIDTCHHMLDRTVLAGRIHRLED